MVQTANTGLRVNRSGHGLSPELRNQSIPTEQGETIQNRQTIEETLQGLNRPKGRYIGKSILTQSLLALAGMLSLVLGTNAVPIGLEDDLHMSIFTQKASGKPAHLSIVSFLPVPDVGLDEVTPSRDQKETKKSSDSTLELLQANPSYAIDNTGVYPAILPNQQISFYKASGQGTAVWYALSMKGVQFSVLEIEEGYPARIINPNGVIVDIHRNIKPQYPQHKDIWATVTTQSGEYFLIPSSVWDIIKQAKVSDSQFSLPIILKNGNFMVANRVAFSSVLKDQVVQIPSSSIVNDFHSMLSSEGILIKDCLVSSARGYMRAKIQSYTEKGKFDTYRVCVYCLAENASLDSDKKNSVFDEESKTQFTPESLSESDVLEETFWDNQHKVASMVFIPDSYSPDQSVLVPLFDGSYYRLGDAAVSALVDYNAKQLLGTKPWFKKLQNSDLQDLHIKWPIILYNDQALELNLTTARHLYYSYSHYQLDDGVVQLFSQFKIDEGVHDLHKLAISDENLDAWFEEGQQVPGLFLLDTCLEVSHGWPFVVRLEDGVRTAYYLNEKLVKVALSVSSEESLEPLDPNVLQFIQSRQEDVHFITPDTPKEQQFILAAKPWAQVKYNGKTSFLSPANLKTLYHLQVADMFVPKRMLTEVKEGELVKLNDQEMVLNAGLMKEIAGSSHLQNDEVRNTVMHLLGQPTSFHGHTTIKTIQFSLQSYFRGTCNGNFIKENECKGTFKGEYHHCKSPTAKYPCEEVVHKFACVDGIMTKKGCVGTLEMKLRLNHSDFALQSEQFSPLSMDQCGLNTKITQKTDTSDIAIGCSKNFHIQAQKCVDATVTKTELLNDGALRVKTKVTCEGTLDLNTLECSSSRMSMIQCQEPATQKNPELCGDHYLRRTCASGGDFKGCFLFNPKDEEFICEGGIYNGKVCEAKKAYIELDDHTFFISSSCSGTYVEKESCDGKFVGKIVDCPASEEERDESITACSEEYATAPISCDGHLTKDECKGDYKGTVVIKNNMNFSVDAPKTETDFKDFNQGLTILNFLNYVDDEEGEDKHWSDMTIECKEGFQSSSNICKNAVFSSKYRDEKGWHLSNIRCYEEFNIETYQCSSGAAVVTQCLSEDETNELPFCRGSFEQLTCTKGGNLNGCSEDDLEKTSIVCSDAYWDGSVCTGKELIIVVNETRYITGKCTGDYVDHTSCDGTFIGGFVNCPTSFLTADINCELSKIDNFTCKGHQDKFGCKGTYDGYIQARGDIIKVTTDEQGFSSSSGSIKNSDVELAFVRNIVESKIKVKLGVDRDLTGVCHGGFNTQSRDCLDAEINITNDFTPNTTYSRITCHGVLNVDTLDCNNGLLSLYSCNGSQLFPDNDRCLGIYHHLDCKHGGNTTNCFNHRSTDVNIFCDGVYKDGKCDPFIVPQLAIIMINESYYLKGTCSSRITDNECRGIFTGLSVVTCTNKSALTVKHVYDHCVPIPNESFGTCIGLTNKHGCLGEYKTTVEINGSLWDFSSTEDSHYNIITVEGMSKLIKQKGGDEDKKHVALSCQSQFNIKELTCDKTILQFVDKSYAEEGPGIAQTISAVCFDGIYDIKELECRSGEYLYYDCIGKSHKTLDQKEGIRFSCLGDLKFSRCASGGKHNKCVHSGENDYTKECMNSFFDGKICLKDKEAENTEIKITSLGSYTSLDTDGQEVIIERFNVEKFHMFGAVASQVELSENILDKVILLNGIKQADGSVVNIEMDQTPAKVSLDEGALHKITFENFALDELPYREFSINDDAQFIKIHFKNVIIHQFMFSNLVSHNSVIRKLSIKDQIEVRNYGVNNLEITKGYGIIQLRDVEMYLPYIKNSTMDAWNSPENKIEYTLSLPSVEDVTIPGFKLRIQQQQKKIFLEFPSLSIEERSLDIIKLEDYILGSTSFTSDPVAAETIIRNYEQYIREHPEEREDAYELSDLEISKQKSVKETSKKTEKSSSNKNSEPSTAH